MQVVRYGYTRQKVSVSVTYWRILGELHPWGEFFIFVTLMFGLTDRVTNRWSPINMEP